MFFCSVWPVGFFDPLGYHAPYTIMPGPTTVPSGPKGLTARSEGNACDNHVVREPVTPLEGGAAAKNAPKNTF